MKDNFGNEDENKENRNIPDCCYDFPVQRLENLNAVSGSAGPFTVTEGTVYVLPVPVNVISVNVDADDSLTDPLPEEGRSRRKLRVLLTFIADISIDDLAFDAELNFYLVRNSCKSTIPLGPVSAFTVTPGVGASVALTHAFRYLDKDVEPGNYTYSVQLAPGSNVTGLEGLLGASVIIQSATLSAIAAVV